jgi:hypothetical protein
MITKQVSIYEPQMLTGDGNAHYKLSNRPPKPVTFMGTDLFPKEVPTSHRKSFLTYSHFPLPRHCRHWTHPTHHSPTHSQFFFFLRTCCCNQLTDSSSVFEAIFFSLLLFTFTYIALLSLYKYLFELVRGIILLFVFEHAVHTFSATDL